MDENGDLFWKQLEREHLKARAYCRKLMANRDDGDDLYHDSLVAALSKFDSLKNIAAFRPWLYRIIINMFKNRSKRSWWRKSVALTDDIPVAENKSIRLDARRRLERAFKALSPEEKALVILHELQGWTTAEMARVVGKSEGSIRVQLSRARNKMRKELIRFLKQSGNGELAKNLLMDKDICIVHKFVKE